MGMQVRFWGVRGSLHADPTPKARVKEVETLFSEFFKAGFKSKSDVKKFLSLLGTPRVGGFGSATTCVSAETDDIRVIIDGGTGIKTLSDELDMRSSMGRGTGEAHIFMTHFHWDHVCGIPFYNPIYIKGNKINIYSVDDKLEDQIRKLFRKPNYPVPFEALGADFEFHKLEPRKPFKLNDIVLTPYELDHPDPCWGYRVEAHGKAYAHCVDSEAKRVSRKELGPDLPLYQNVDLMFFDGQFSEDDFPQKSNWGHGTATRGLEIAMRENVRHIVFTHHEPKASWKEVSRLIEQADEFYNSILGRKSKDGLPYKEVLYEFGFEGMDFSL